METTTTGTLTSPAIGRIITGCFTTTASAGLLDGGSAAPKATTPRRGGFATDVEPMARRRSAFAPLGLTPSEHDVVALVAQGASNREIAHELGISRRTVESHLEHVFVKLEIKSRLRLAVLYLSAGGAGTDAPSGTDRE